MWPPPATDFRPGGSDVTEMKNKRKRKKKKRRSSSQDYTSSTTESTGDHVNGGAKGPTSPPRPNAKPSPEQQQQQQQQQQRAGGDLDPVTGATRARRNSEDVVAAAGGGRAGGSGEVVPKVGGDAGGKAYDDDDDDDDQDEGVVIQREGIPTPALANGKEKTIKKKKKTAAAADVVGGNGVGGGGVDTAAGNAVELAKKEKRKVKEKDQKKSQGADRSEEVEPSGIPFALPMPGARATSSIKPTGRSRSASIESAAEFFSTKAVSGDKANGTIDDGRGATAANSNAGAIINGSVHDGGEPGHGSGRRKREEGSGGVGAATAALSKGRVPRKHQEQRRGLPIFAHKADIIRAVKDHQTIVVVGETGSGKSTQIPQFLYEAGITRGGAGWIPGGESGEATTAIRGSGKKRGRAPSQEDVFKGSSSSSSSRDKRGFQGGLIACTQPRRVAAVTVAKRVAAEVGCDLGNTVGYTVRFDDRTSKSTRIKYMTDGVLLREAMSDPLLSAYSAIVLDEAHERSLDTDILFGLVRRLQPKRPDLKVVVMSATLDVDLFRRFFRDSVSLHVPGRTHPVDVMYATEDQDDYLDACLMTCLQIHEDEKGDGDVLVFLPGQDDIEALSQLLRENLATLRAEKSRELAAAAADAAAAAGDEEFQRPRAGGLDDLRGQGDGLLRESMVCPVFAALPQEQQLEAFEPAPRGTRKFVLATNIAETSITINGIRYVVDSGKVKVRSFQASTGMEFLRSQDVSKAQATQRAGRAGREAPGVCYRLFRQGMKTSLPDSYLELGDAPIPEILRVNLAQVVLQLKVMGIDDPSTFDYVTAPSRAALLKALKTLAMLGALDKSARVTPDGKKMAALPLDPAFAHLLVRSAEPRFSCVKEVLTTVACLSAENLLFYPPKEEAKRAANEAHRSFSAYEGDLPTLLRIYEGFLKERKDRDWCRRNFVNGRSVARAVDVRQQLAKILRERLRIDPEESCGAETSQYLRCLVAGLFTNVALRQPSTSGGGSRGCYRTVLGGRYA
ncbi:unnamed protein product, partial [Ectocarpus sp. 12 AP-2014]